MYKEKKEPLFRKVNTTARGVHHLYGSDYSNERNSKPNRNYEFSQSTMHGKKERGLDYTPLFRFLLSKINFSWDEVFSEVKSRLDKTDPIFWLVAKLEREKQEIVRVGESTYYSGLFVDGDGKLKLVNSNLKNEDLHPLCPCCTHTFNGEEFRNKFEPNPPGVLKIRTLKKEE